MKSKMKIYLPSITVLCFFVFSPQQVVAQEWYTTDMQGQLVESNVITLAGDTIKGQLIFDRPQKMSRQIRFLAEGTEDAVKYQADEIKGFTIYGRLWEGVLVKPIDRYYFLLPVFDGKVKLMRLYKNFVSTQLRVDEDGYQYNETNNGYFKYVLIKKDIAYEYDPYEDWLYSELIFQYVQDCEVFIEKLKNQEFMMDDLETLIKRYNLMCEEQ